MLNWLKRFNIFCLLDNQQYHQLPQGFECLAGAGVKRSNETATVRGLDEFLQSGRWYFGHMSYELHTGNFSFGNDKRDLVRFPSSFFFEPEVVLLLREGGLTVEADDPAAVYEQIAGQPAESEDHTVEIALEPGLSRQQYLQVVERLREHIHRGDCYEINFCQEFFNPAASIDPFGVFSRLMKLSPNPFSAFYRLNDRFLICASPERFLRKQGTSLISQPIKGTIRRDLNDTANDNGLKEALRSSEKDRAENVMVVDLVRNDLSRICEDNSVEVEELFGIYSYPQVHQMISTVKGQLREGTSFSRIIEATFPMGSMTGAPKQRVMELIEQYEGQRRGVFSGAVGYIAPNQDFDFNVVIRSLMYNRQTGYLSCQVGSGITFYSSPEQEWEECLLKAEAIKKVLAG